MKREPTWLEKLDHHYFAFFNYLYKSDHLPLPHMTKNKSPHQKHLVDPIGHMRERGDRLMLCVLGIGTLVSLALGFEYGRPEFALWCSAGILAVGAPMYIHGAGRPACRYVLTLLAFLTVALQIQISLGNLQYHFGVFVVLAFLLAYQDWRLIIFGAATTAAHHIVFDRLQLAGVPFYCLPEPNFRTVLEHAGFVVAQTAAEVFLAVGMLKQTRQGMELQVIANTMCNGERIVLDTAGCPAKSPVAQQLRAVLDRISAALGQVQVAAHGVTHTADAIAAGNADLRQRTADAADSISVTSASTVKLSQSVTCAARAATKTADLAVRAHQAAQSAGGEIHHIVDTMSEIRLSIEQVCSIVSTIDSIATQTNLLAVNAAVEAAHAGEQGKGFGVVASEVRTLAQRAAMAAGDIRRLSEQSATHIDEGASLVDAAGHSMRNIVDLVQEVALTMRELSALTRDSASQIELANRAITSIGTSVHHNASLSEQTLEASTSLNAMADHLTHVLSCFQTKA